MMTTIQVRIDKKTKKEAKNVLDQIGLDMSAAITIYLRQISLKKHIPFPLLTKNGLTLQEEREILKASKEATQGKNVTKPMNAKQALHYLHAL